MTHENERTNAREEMSRGDQALQAARELMRLGLYNDAVSRAYYGAYHWARALLFTKGLESKTHRGMIQLVALRFVREKLIDQKAATWLAQLEDAREASDYTASVQFSESETTDIISRAEDFISLCRLLLSAFEA